MRTRLLALGGLLSLMSSLGCGDDEASSGQGGSGAAGATGATNGSTGASTSGPGSGGGGVGGNGDAPTFYDDVAWILHDKCLHCHTDGQIGGFSLEAYEDAGPLSASIVEMTESGQMPPFNAKETDDCEQIHPWKDDPRLTEEELAILAAWDAAGAPAGDPANGPAPYELTPTTLPGATMTITPSQPFTVEGESDSFECFVYDPALTGPAFMNGVHFVAGDSTVTHHALTFKIGRAEAEELSGGAERFSCFGAPPGELVHAWAPGGQPFDLPEGVGVSMDEETVLVVQIHYHPLATPKEDASTLELRFTDERPQWLFQVALPGNSSSEGDGLLPGPNDRSGAEFRIPAGAKGHTEEMTFHVPDEIPIEIPILFAATHMHYVGTDMRLSVERGDPGDQPAEECFVRTPGWDFNWQRFYQFDRPLDELPTVRGGDTLRMKCTYDNSLDNEFVRQALEDQGLSEPIDVYLGEQTLDEMCLGALGILVPNLE
jgi:hypothetical protein